MNEDGLKTANEEYLSGWEIRVYVDLNQDGDLDQVEFDAGALDADVTHLGGEFSLQLPNATDSYVVVEVLKDGWAQTGPGGTSILDGSLDTGNEVLGTFGYAVSSATGLGQDLDFGNVNDPFATITGTKFSDTNGDGVWDVATESGLNFWTIVAFADNGDGVLDASEIAAGSTAAAVTGSTGSYELQLLPGDYVIVEVLSTDWEQTLPRTMSVNSIAVGLSEFGYAVSVAAGDQLSRLDFGNVESLVQVRGSKIEDANGNGIRDALESPLSGWEIHAFVDANSDGQLDASERAAGPVATSLTDQNGEYQFDLAPGNYILLEVTQGLFTQTFGGNVILPSDDLTYGPFGHVISVQAGRPLNGLDFGNTPASPPANARLLGTKFENVIDGTPLSGWQIEVYEDDGDGVFGMGDRQVLVQSGPNQPFADFDRTEADGGYDAPIDFEFNDFSPGLYFVVEELQPGYQQLALGTATSGSAGGSQFPIQQLGFTDGGRLGDFGYALDLQEGFIFENVDFVNQPCTGKRCYLATSTGVAHASSQMNGNQNTTTSSVNSSNVDSVFGQAAAVTGNDEAESTTPKVEYAGNSGNSAPDTVSSSFVPVAFQSKSTTDPLADVTSSREELAETSVPASNVDRPIGPFEPDSNLQSSASAAVVVRDLALEQSLFDSEQPTEALSMNAFDAVGSKVAEDALLPSQNRLAQPFQASTVQEEDQESDEETDLIDELFAVDWDIA